MPYLHISMVLLLSLHIPAANSATTDTISAGQALSTIGDKLVSKNGKYALGFFKVGNNSSQNTSNWYLGIWFNSVPKFTQAWVANRDDPFKSPTTSAPELKISHDGNLVVLNQSTNSIIWSTQAKMTRNNTIALLLDSGNFILRNASNSSHTLWQSFDHPTDTFLPGMKLGWDNITGLNRRLVSRKNSISPATGVYCEELDPSGINQVVLVKWNSTTQYWSSGVWNGQHWPSLPDEASGVWNDQTGGKESLVTNAHEKYYTYAIVDYTAAVYYNLDVSGQINVFVWPEGSHDWLLTFSQPRAQCDVYSVCGPFAICNDDALPHCTCTKGFSITSPEDWELNDQTGGCTRNTPLDCITKGSSTRSTDKFLSLPCVSLAQSVRRIEDAQSIVVCAQVCLDNCYCTAYSFSNGTCSNWHGELSNIRQIQCSSAANSKGETLYLRLAAKDFQGLEKNKRVFIIAVATGTSVAALGLFAFSMLIMIGRNKRKSSGQISNTAQGCNGIIAFRYNDLKLGTKNFSQKLGGGGFGSVFKGFLNNSTAIAVKELCHHSHQGEKQFRAEVSSIGIIQHINLVKLIGFCCEGARRLLVYEYMSNGSLATHLFQNHATVLTWRTRYQIALGVARGLAYLHEKCRDCIIHCDIKPENILLSDSYVPKIADFGMAKFLGRDFSRVITTMRGTIGYLAPEWISGVAITPKVDVYAYGMVLLEIVSGKRNSCVSCSCGSNHDIYYPVHVAQEIIGGDIMSLLDSRLCGKVNLKEAEITCKVACWCIQDDEFDRPTMGEVVQIMEGLLEINIPPMPRLLQTVAGSSNYSTCC
ncbi:hypothetical protein PVAP13_8KG247200 [Panicum virgatum]|uniref:Receptor-like serine/threonine-protein kinase n=1 Tax=Panicum virgatum TaxID=38727 RepID=A0A8T0PTH2_PANVG|nr:hypothetical protein PVAP13_8KG247200 [Panicum virgatum]